MIIKVLRVLFVTWLVLFLIYGALNYSGFCFKEMRYLSDEEKIRIAVAKVNKMGGWRHLKELGWPSNRYKKIIPYESVDAFLQENPDCCTIVPYAGFEHVTDEPVPPSFWERFFGIYNSAVRIQYTRRYIEGPLDKNKKMGPGEKHEEFLIGDYHIDNCGEGTRSTSLSKIAVFYTTKCQ